MNTVHENYENLRLYLQACIKQICDAISEKGPFCGKIS